METLKTGGIARTGYMGGNEWIGCNYKGYRRYSEINKIVKQAFNAEFKNSGNYYKISCTGSSFSGGQECNGKITMLLKDAVYSLEEFLENANKNNYCTYVSSWYYINGEAVWGEKLDSETRLRATYSNYINLLSKEWGVTINGIAEKGLEACILKPQARAMVNALNNMYDSFNYEDINGMVDYFDVMFYKQVQFNCIEA